MSQLPPDVVAALVRGVGAYIRTTPQNELPAKLRPLQNFTVKALARHSKDVVAALDDEAFRARVKEWIDDKKPSLNKSDLSTLRVAAARDEGWVERLAEISPDRTQDAGTKRQDDKLPALLERERAKVERAKEDLRRLKEESTAEVTRCRAEVSALKEQLAAANSRARAAETEARAASSRTARAEEAGDRVTRKAKAAVAKAQGAADIAKKKAAEARGATAALQARIRALEAQLERAKRSSKARRPSTEGTAEPRRALKVPAGRFEDAPETLEAWLQTPEVLLLVDGYNVTKAEGGYGDLDLSIQRDRLIEGVSKLVRLKEARALIVFDGSKVPPGVARRARGSVQVEYSRPDEIADDHLVARLEELPPTPVILATNDRELQTRARERGATIATSQQLLTLIR